MPRMKHELLASDTYLSLSLSPQITKHTILRSLRIHNFNLLKFTYANINKYPPIRPRPYKFFIIHDYFTLGLISIIKICTSNRWDSCFPFHNFYHTLVDPDDPHNKLQQELRRGKNEKEKENLQ